MDDLFSDNRDWDPVYLAGIFDVEFEDLLDMWNSDGLSDSDLSVAMEAFEQEKYCPVVEDILMDDSTLCSAVKAIERE